jgi:protocatechuate 3,4-dioxygenase beta subunit
MTLLLSSWTNSDGTYTFGPLSNTRSYHVLIQKSGYVFTRKSSSLYDFNSEKLASILVQIKDVDGVFLLLTSSTNNMRRRTATTDSTGEVLFDDLQPGKYYLRPQLREYNFQPEDAQIEIKSGDEIISKFQTQRIAFSCYGQVTSLNNEPESGLIIDAQGIDQCESVTRESAKTDINGQFRLRALQPGCQYRLQYRSNPNELTQTDIIQIEPKNKIIEIIDSDLYQIHLYSIKRPSDIDINVFVQTQTSFLSQIKVKFNQNLFFYFFFIFKIFRLNYIKHHNVKVLFKQ